MYKIIRTIYHYKDGKREISNEVKEVQDLEEYRKKLMKKEHERINFVYEIV